MSAEAAGLLSQRVQALWPDERDALYAVLLGSRMPGLGARLDGADVDDWGVLWTGVLDAQERAAAPCLVRLRRDADFTRWLFSDDVARLGDWGLLLHSHASFIALRSHGRALCRATSLDGQELRLDWADPAVLQALLPLASPQQLAWVFTDIDAITVIGTRQWLRLSLVLGRLHEQRSNPVAAD